MRTALSQLLLCHGAAPAERTASESDIDATMHSICATQTPSTHRSSCTLARGATALCPWHWDSRRSPRRVVNKSRRSNISNSAIDWMHADAHLESSLANAHASTLYHRPPTLVALHSRCEPLVTPPSGPLSLLHSSYTAKLGLVQQQ
jgi:hypothetical protein